MADNKNFILVTGFAHGATTITRKLVGNAEGVYDFTKEIDAIIGVNPDQFIKIIANTNYKSIVVKSPFTPTNILSHTNFKIILVLRNPYDIYGSFRLRFKNEGHYTASYADRYGYNAYVNLCNKWLEVKRNPGKYPNIFPIKYEEMFVDDYKKLKEMISWLGLKWNDNIINSVRVAGHQYINNKPVPVVGDPSILKNTGADNVPYRYWQINQPFKDMTGESSKYIFKTTKAKLDSLPIIKELGYDVYGKLSEIEAPLPK